MHYHLHAGQKFSKVHSIVPFYSKIHRAADFLEFLPRPRLFRISSKTKTSELAKGVIDAGHNGKGVDEVRSVRRVQTPEWTLAQEQVLYMIFCS
jgi:hypothetical protein